MLGEPDPCVIVIFGASGDLTARKLIPALYELDVVGTLPRETCVLGVSRTLMSDDAWRDHLQPGTAEHAKGYDPSRWEAFAKRLFYFAGDATVAETYAEFTERIETLSRHFKCHGNVLFYLSVTPSLYEPIVHRIDESSLILEGRRWCSLNREAMPWQRIIVEKPFGHDLESAHTLNLALGRVFEEDAIYRIDHYLGKELVQNLLVLRFANTIFEPLWNHRYIDHVQISATETVGVGDRAAFYDETGALRDMIQSHLLQVLALVAMEPPSTMQAHHIRQEKVKIIDAIEPPGNISRCAAFGQYSGGGDDDSGLAYHELPGVAPGSTTETFAAIALRFDNWRWAGTPFYIRTGKRMARKRTEIVIQFKQPPAKLFRHLEQFASGGERPANRIVIEIAPREGVSMRFEGKVPGSGITLDSVTMDFDYAHRFEAEPQEAYGPLILDAMRGDQTLFKHRYDVEGAWKAVMPFLDSGADDLRKDIHANYPPGSWGPKSADAMLARDGRAWHNRE
ncbi:MAG: glucose-6-phosphate dehydrogenase [Planctomycetes bacterium]|nr:glucose-6-phosphate dehydrogenase [Planctomycetota bacterium]